MQSCSVANEGTLKYQLKYGASVHFFIHPPYASVFCFFADKMATVLSDGALSHRLSMDDFTIPLVTM